MKKKYVFLALVLIGFVGFLKIGVCPLSEEYGYHTTNECESVHIDGPLRTGGGKQRG